MNRAPVQQSRPPRRTARAVIGMGIFLALVAAPGIGGGFAFPHQSAKAMGMGGAFVAQAQDPSAVFFNPGALALLPREPKLSAGTAVFNLNESLYQGRPPGIGTGSTAEQESLREVLPHAFVAQSLGERARAGFGLYSPFSLETQWAGKDDFVGRYVTLTSSVATIDLAATAATRLGERFGVGVGVIYRTSDLTLLRRLPTFDPAASMVVDAASVAIEATMDDGFGWTAGVLHRASDSFTWGLSYRSGIDVDYSGTSKITQIPTGNDALDELLAATIPFDQDLALASRIEFPDQLALGLALHGGDRLIVELDLIQTGWRGFSGLSLVYPNNPELDSMIFQGFEDTTGYRLGASYETAGGTVFRAGLSLDETPQPDAAVGAFFPDGDRTGYHAGLSRDWLDVALVWIDVADRLIANSVDGLNGAYNGDAWILGITVNK